MWGNYKSVQDAKPESQSWRSAAYRQRAPRSSDAQGRYLPRGSPRASPSHCQARRRSAGGYHASTRRTWRSRTSAPARSRRCTHQTPSASQVALNVARALDSSKRPLPVREQVAEMVEHVFRLEVPECLELKPLADVVPELLYLVLNECERSLQCVISEL
ncbi:hypothetical protein BC834DRAFT_909627 [Gloeopeniophorella convolvens]|nr:hypothetical protein BC834DRAFT_909627 [Gloeopeniophorella convolvens]